MLPIALIRLLIRRQLVGERSKRVNFVSNFSFFLLLSCVDHNRAGLVQSSLGEPDSLGWFPMAVADCRRCKRSRGTRRHTRKLRAAPQNESVPLLCCASAPKRVLHDAVYSVDSGDFQVPPRGLGFLRRMCVSCGPFLWRRWWFSDAPRNRRRERYTHEQNATE